MGLVRGDERGVVVVRGHREGAPIADHALERRYLAGAMIDPRILDEHPLPIGVFGHATLTARSPPRWPRSPLVASGSPRSASTTSSRTGATTRRGPPALLVGRRSALTIPRRSANACERGGPSRARARDRRGAAHARRRRSSSACRPTSRARRPRIAAEDRTAAVHPRPGRRGALRETQRAAEGTARATFTTGPRPSTTSSTVGPRRCSSSPATAARARARRCSWRREPKPAPASVLIVSVEDHAVRWGRRTPHAGSGVSIRQLKSGDLRPRVAGTSTLRSPRSRARRSGSRPRSGRPRRGHAHDPTRPRAATSRSSRRLLAGDRPAPAANADHALRHHIRDCLEAGRRETGRGAEPLTLIFGSQYRKREDETKRPRTRPLRGQPSTRRPTRSSISGSSPTVNVDGGSASTRTRTPAEGTLARDPRGPPCRRLRHLRPRARAGISRGRMGAP